jgi:hypothetical protein
MERRRSLGHDTLSKSCSVMNLSEEAMLNFQDSAINFPGNPWFWPRVAFKMAPTSLDMDDRKRMLTNDALLVKEEGSLSVRSCDELRDIIFHHFGIRKHEVYVYHSHPHPFIIIFSDRHARDVVFAAGRAIDGAVELRFSAWDIDKFGDRTNIPYHVKLSIEGIPQHAWSHEIAAKVLGDEAFIHHVKEATRKRIDRRTYQCWAFSLDPSHIPQIVFLTMIDSEVEIVTDVHFIRPREVKKGHVFKVLIHIDVVEDLLFSLPTGRAHR